MLESGKTVKNRNLGGVGKQQRGKVWTWEQLDSLVHGSHRHLYSTQSVSSVDKIFTREDKEANYNLTITIVPGSNSETETVLLELLSMFSTWHREDPRVNKDLPCKYLGDPFQHRDLFLRTSFSRANNALRVHQPVFTTKQYKALHSTFSNTVHGFVALFQEFSSPFTSTKLHFSPPPHQLFRLNFLRDCRIKGF